MTLPIIFLFLFVLFYEISYANPNLQLDIEGGIYDASTETIISTHPKFKLFAFLIPDASNTLDDWYYISASVVPKIDFSIAGNYGAFSLNGNIINVTNDMVFGVPPLESLALNQGLDIGDLGLHSIFSTFFKEVAFQFNPNNKTMIYNSALDPGGLKGNADSSQFMYYAEFTVDTTLVPEYSIHFDLYNKQFENCQINADCDITRFAPFDHDAESGKYPVVSLPRTGQTTCYDSAGAVIPCAGTGQDGDIQAGVPWPDPKFTDNGDETVTDNLTGLMWTQDGNAPGPVACSPATKKTWQGALDYVACLNSNSYLGYTDWRLPNVNELRSLLYAEQPNTATWLNSQGFINVQSFLYWSSTSTAYYLSLAWTVDMWTPTMGGSPKSNGLYVWPVRSGQAGSLGNSIITLPRTGQTTCYASAGNAIPCAGTRQDGELQAGVPWPNPRFTDNGDATVTDNLTGLIWTQDGNAPGPATCSPATTKTWQDALNYVACLNTNSYLGYTDWRLPNSDELMTLVNRGQTNTATWLNSQGFINVQSYDSWSSTSFVNYPGFAWIVDIVDGFVYYDDKSTNYGYAWPVRSGHVAPQQGPSLITFGKPVSITTNGVLDYSDGHPGEWPEDVTDGSLDCQPVSLGIEDGCLGWQNKDYNETLNVDVTIDLQGTYRISKIRYNMGNVQRGDTWTADRMISPLGDTATIHGGSYQGAWTEHAGDIVASSVTVTLVKARTSNETDWLFIGEIEIYGVPVTGTVDRAPILDPIGSKTVNEGAFLNFAVNGSDPDGGPLSFEACDSSGVILVCDPTSLPFGVFLDPTTGAFSWTPDYNQAGLYNITFIVRDSKGKEDAELITITVNDASPPTTDADSDGLSDYEETHQFYTDPNNPDTDGDGVGDKKEIIDGTDPRDSTNFNRNITACGLMLSADDIKWMAGDLWQLSGNLIIGALSKPLDNGIRINNALSELTIDPVGCTVTQHNLADSDSPIKLGVFEATGRVTLIDPKTGGIEASVIFGGPLVQLNIVDVQVDVIKGMLSFSSSGSIDLSLAPEIHLIKGGYELSLDIAQGIVRASLHIPALDMWGGAIKIGPPIGLSQLPGLPSDYDLEWNYLTATATLKTGNFSIPIATVFAGPVPIQICGEMSIKNLTVHLGDEWHFTAVTDWGFGAIGVLNKCLAHVKMAEVEISGSRPEKFIRFKGSPIVEFGDIVKLKIMQDPAIVAGWDGINQRVYGIVEVVAGPLSRQGPAFDDWVGARAALSIFYDKALVSLTLDGNVGVYGFSFLSTSIPMTLDAPHGQIASWEAFMDENGNGLRDNNEEYIDINENEKWDDRMKVHLLLRDIEASFIISYDVSKPPYAKGRLLDQFNFLWKSYSVGAEWQLDPSGFYLTGSSNNREWNETLYIYPCSGFNLNNIPFAPGWCFQLIPGGLVIEMGSPANLHVYDSINRHVGLNIDGSVSIEIPGAQFLRPGGTTHQIVVIPEPDLVAGYRVGVDGTGDGVFDLNITKPDASGTYVEDYSFSNIPVKSSTQADVFLDINGVGILKVDQSGDGVLDESYEALEHEPFPLAVDLPCLRIIQPDGTEDVSTGSYTITWVDRDSKGDGILSFYYDQDNLNYNGSMIAEGISETDLNNKYVWDTSNMPPGNYYIYGILTDSLGRPISSYSLGKVTIGQSTPRIISRPSQKTFVVAPYVYQVGISNPDGDPVSVALSGYPKGMTMDSVSHTLSWVPSIAQIGANQVILSVENSQGGRDNQVFDIYVINDEISPTISASISSTPNTEGWHNTDATVTYTCSDSESGIASCPFPVTVNTEGAGQVITGVGTDNAGNSASTSVTINLDKTPPVVSPPADIIVEATGLQTLVSLGTATATDGTSGVVSLTNDGFASYPLGTAFVTWTATDAAGNSGTAVQMVTVIDTLPPSIAGSQYPQANGAGWNKSDVTVSFSCSDANSSGIAVCTPPVSVSNEGASQVINGTAVDNGGNNASTSVTLNIDKTLPDLIMPVLNMSYTYRSKLSLNFGAEDSLSGIDAVTATINGVLINSGDLVTLNLVGQNIFTLSAIDKAGNGSTQSISFEVVNTPPAAEAGVDLSLKCLEMSCTAILDGTGSTDPNSTPGTQDDIVLYEWLENYTGGAGELPVAVGKTVSLDLPLGDHLITLVVTDTVGAKGEDTIKVSINPAQLSMLEVNKTEVEWSKDASKPDKVKIHGKVAMPAGKDYFLVNPVGTLSVGISSLSGVINQAVTFTAKGEHGSKWEYKADPIGTGISQFLIDWDGARFDYNKEIRIKSNHLGQNTTTLEIDRKNITESLTITVQDVTIRIDSAGAVTVDPVTVQPDVDDDGEIEVILPFALAQNTIFTVNYGTVSSQIKVGDYYSAAVGKFEIIGQFKAVGLNGNTRPATLDLGITLGNQKFPGTVKLLDSNWTQLKSNEWKFKR